MMIPTVAPIVMPLPSLGHRKFCVAGFARDTPDSGGAAIMGVPLPHLVLPLSGCLSRRTPTRATRGDARGHRSVLAQNPLFMHPILFPSFELVVGMVCPRHMVGWSQCVCAAEAAPCLIPSDGVTLRTCGSPTGTQHDGLGSVCCWCIASWFWCRPASGMSAPSQCRALVHSRCQWCRDRLGHYGSARLCVWPLQSSDPQWSPEDRGGLGGRGYDSLSFLGACVSLR